MAPHFNRVTAETDLALLLLCVSVRVLSRQGDDSGTKLLGSARQGKRQTRRGPAAAMELEVRVVSYQARTSRRTALCNVMVKGSAQCGKAPSGGRVYE